MMSTYKESNFNPATIGDLDFVDQYMFVADLNDGMYVIQLSKSEQEDDQLSAKSCFLYALTSGPNEIHIQNINQLSYQLVVSTTVKNEALIFDPINYN